MFPQGEETWFQELSPFFGQVYCNCLCLSTHLKENIANSCSGWDVPPMRLFRTLSMTRDLSVAPRESPDCPSLRASNEHHLSN
jgi:hypothetical protein